MNTKNRQAVIDGLAKQIAIATQQGDLDQVEKLAAALEHQTDQVELNTDDLANINSQVKRNYYWNEPLPKQLHEAHADLEYAQVQLNAWRNRRNAEAIRYWHHQLERAQLTLAELTSWLAQNRPDVLQAAGDWKPSPNEQHTAPYDDDAPDVLH